MAGSRLKSVTHRLRAVHSPPGAALLGKSGQPSIGTLDLTVDAAGRIRGLQRAGDIPLRFLKRLEEGMSISGALHGAPTAFAAGLLDALEMRRAARGVAVGDAHGLVLRYDLFHGDADAPRLRVDLCESGPDELAALAAASRAHGDCLAQLCSLANRGSTTEELARAVLPLLVSAAQAECGAIYVVNSDGDGEALSVYGSARRRGFPYPSLQLDEQPLASIMQRPGVVTLAPADAASLAPGLLDVCPRHCGLIAVAPCFAGHAKIGLFVVSRSADALLSFEEASLLAAAADAVGLALANAALSQESHLSEVVLDTACVVARAISGSLDLNETFRQVASSTALIIGDCRCLLLEAEEEPGDLIAVAASDPADEALLGLRVRFDDDAGNQAALQELRSVLVDDVVWGAGTQSVYHERLTMRSALFVPIHADGALIGCLLLLSSGRRDSYSPTDVARADTVAEQAASAICNARLYRDLARSRDHSRALLERISTLRQRSRQDLASAIHDDVVQTVVAALYELESFREQIDPDSLADLERAMSLLRQTITEARRVIMDLRPPALEGLGLRRALAALTERVSGTTSATIGLKYGDIPELDEGSETALYLIAREALQNARRHAEATRIGVSLGLSDASQDSAPHVVLRIEDDGRGFEVSRQDTNDHFGLTMMDEQAALAGGFLTVTSSPEGGTVVEGVVPVRLEKRESDQWQ